MFREMRRTAQVLSEERVRQILAQKDTGVLAVCGEEGYPYTIPLNYVYLGEKIYVHSAVNGHKIDAIGQNAKVSFCVISKDQNVPEELTNYYESVVVFGKAAIVTDAEEKKAAILALGNKFSPQMSKEKLTDTVDGAWERFCVIAIEPEHISGKQGKALVGKAK